MREFRRRQLETLLRRLAEPRRFIQVLAGPRQTGKTTLARQAAEESGIASHYATADEPAPRDPAWIETQWERGRLLAETEQRSGALLVLDEVQKVDGWSETVKRLWDEDTAARSRLRVVVLGSAPLLIERGTSESLAGRFELIRVPHWSFAEMRDAFGFSFDRYVLAGGYPGAAPLVRDQGRWRRYLQDSLIETTIARDVLLLTRVDKPALLRQLFRLGCEYTGQVLSYQKMLGQLQDAGNTTTVAHYLRLLEGAGMLMGLQKLSGSAVRRRGSSPKLLVLNTGLATATLGLRFREARQDPAIWGRLVESAVGAHLVQDGAEHGIEVFYWRDRGHEVDFVLRRGRSVAGIEVTTGSRKEPRGIEAFRKAFSPRRVVTVGGQGIPAEEFLQQPTTRWLR